MSRLERAARVLDQTGLAALLRATGSWTGVLTLAYHRIGYGEPSTFDRNAWSATPEIFDAQSRFLSRNVEVIGPRDLEYVRGRASGRYVILTFDDGYRDSHAHALPILRSHGLTATFFPITGYLDDPRVAWWDEIAWMVRTSPEAAVPAGRWLPAPVRFDGPEREAAVRSLLDRYKELRRHETAPFLDFLAEATRSGRYEGRPGAEQWMTWDMVRELHRSGMTVGGHTVTHPVLSTLPLEEQRGEIGGCRRRIEAELGAPVIAFSYPVGWPDCFDRASRTCVREEGIPFAFSNYGGYRRFDAEWDPHDMLRSSVAARMSPARFRAMATLPRTFARW